EFRVGQMLEHPNLIKIHALELVKDWLFRTRKVQLLIEYVNGKTLDTAPRLRIPQLLQIFVQVASGLVHMHRRNVFHADLKPNNIMVSKAGDVKIIDFGTARGQNRRCRTVAGVVFAKPGYVAPEVANNTPGGVPADLYAFGVILWELVSGRRFLVGEPAAHLAAVGAGKKVLPPIAQSVGAPPELDRVIAKLSALAVEERMPSAREATAELVRILKRAPSLGDGDRSVRGRIAGLMGRLYPAEPARSRAEFQALVRPNRSKKGAPPPLPQSPAPPESGVVVLPGTRYRIERELGRGAMGVVYQGFHLDLGRKVALKVLHQASPGEAAKATFVAEARAVARVSHESLVRLYEFGFTSEGKAFYAMELVDGETLDERLRKHGAMPVAAAVGLGVGACRAVEAVHAAGLIHRDVKPGNLMVTSDGVVKLLDFGVAKQESEVNLGDDVDGGALVVVGTPEYMAPEQARGRADERSDVYALGAVLYELVTGALPHDAPSIAALIDRKQAGAPGPASAVAPGQMIPKGLDRVLERALAPEPSERFQSVSELRDALEGIAGRRAARRTMGRGIGYAMLGVATFAATAVLGASLSTGGAAGWAGYGKLLAGRARALVASGPSSTESPVVVQQRSTAPSVPAAGAPSEASATADAAAPSAPSMPEPTSEPSEAPAPTPVAPTSEPAAKALAEFESLDANGRALKALHVIRKAAAEFPSEPAILRAHARAAQKAKAWGEARRAAARWVEVDPSPEARLSLARLERATGNASRAIALLTELAKEDPKSDEVRRLLALLPTEQKIALR
ncbi:MAG TPA: protein kinase, partial [Polyangiaceae bacterium]